MLEKKFSWREILLIVAVFMVAILMIFLPITLKLLDCNKGSKTGQNIINIPVNVQINGDKEKPEESTKPDDSDKKDDNKKDPNQGGSVVVKPPVSDNNDGNKDDNNKDDNNNDNNNDDNPVEEVKGNLVSTLLRQYNEANTTGLLKDNQGNYYYKGTNAQVANNFVWFEGHLWRVIRVNSDNTVTMITQQPLTTITGGEALWETKEQYEQTYLNKWLNEVFYRSISDKSKIQKNNFNIGIVKPYKIDIFTEQYVGLLTYDEYVYEAGGKDSYLDIKDWFWLGSINKFSELYIWASNYDGGHNVYWQNYNQFGIRPVIRISDLTITKGHGTMTNPYREDSKANSTSNVKVGDYISVPTTGTDCGTDGKCLFRVVSKDNDSVKVILNGVLPYASSFDAGDHLIFSSQTTINKVLLSFADTISTTYRYTGLKSFNVGVVPRTPHKAQDYNVVKELTYQGTIGLPTYGEMFSGNDLDLPSYSVPDTIPFVNRNTIENANVLKDYWMMNIDGYENTANNILTMSGDGANNSGYPTSSFAIRPTLFLKAGLNFNGGDGTAENPYKLG